ncbi:hypothetical protein FOL47_005702 [Perkinsus chesapeaki]|uniref:Uncharacterized protein n=1 Tax=Perkinsus chesapeaki TaxID=330153 RepID=A0A7J6LW97_PERCH|nr:hypothetical protein FOL47_005702 [Perkinsus chesapeaki]
MFIFGFFVLLASIPSGAFDFNSIDIFEPATTAAFSMVGDISHSMEEFYDALETEKEDEHSPMLEDRRLTTTSAPPDSGAAASSGGTGVPLVSGKDYPEALLIVVSVLSALAFGASLLQLWLTVKIRMALLETRKIKEARWPEEDLQANDVEMGL